MHHHRHHWDQEAWAFMGRGGPNPGWGRGGPRGGGRGGWGGGAFRVGKMLADGDLRLIVLALLAEGPRHGYEIIKTLEEKSSGIYSPSPGVIYPTLIFLEEAGYAVSNLDGSKKVYTITEAGRAHLEENRDVADIALSGIEKFGRKMAQARAWWDGQRGDHAPDRDIPGVIDAVNDARRDLKDAIAEKLDGASEELQRRLANAMRDAAKAIRGLSGTGKKDDVIDL